ncbi:MAG: alpha/beta hydrolase [Candidatus Eisenbacteria bacterium]|uniref:Alpha/beta hydrolase n=1 Tax=Eiseniibacteriota bacterium TaxID=2212470 RepID=A0A849SHD0_UNCEI|nr:alpha/beta hydrolase [Candidatus Eisenbacteria bacterium]
MKRIAIIAIAIAAALIAAASQHPARAADVAATLKTTELGKGPTIVLVHSLGGGRMQWIPTTKRLMSNHRVVMVDLPGHGGSTMPDPFSFEASAAALAQLLSQYKAESTIVVGQGIGGLISLVAAGTHPERLKGLMLIDAAARLEMQIPEQQQKYFLEYLESNYDAVMKPMFLAQARDSAEGVVLWATASQVPAITMKSYFRTLLNFDGSKYARGFKPALMFVGTEKVWPTEKKWEELAKSMGYEEAAAIPNRRLTGAAASVWAQQPDSLAALISAFADQAYARK